MNLTQALQASTYNTAQQSEHSYTYTVDGSLLDGAYEITAGVEGMPPRNHWNAENIEAALQIIQEQGRDNDEWQPIGEHGEPQDDRPHQTTAY